MLYNPPMLPSRLQRSIDQAKFNARIWRTLRSGPFFTSRLDRIIIDLAHCCDLQCPGCNRSCGLGQAPAAEFIGLDQIERFVAESVAAGKNWRRIMLEGGEPTLHPRLPAILEVLLHFREHYSPASVIELCTNGYGPLARRLSDRPPPGVRVKNSAKSPQRKNRHIAFNVAPIDMAGFAGADFSQGCYIHSIFGLGLTRHGYYPHPICGGIDRVFGFNVGLKKLSDVHGGIHGQMSRLCPYCGHFREFRGRGERSAMKALKHGADDSPPERMSHSWLEAYRNYRRDPPGLPLY
ncbi:MAG TPA: radical SAM protein [Acidobacteriota bacterium]